MALRSIVGTFFRTRKLPKVDDGPTSVWSECKQRLEWRKECGLVCVKGNYSILFSCVFRHCKILSCVIYRKLLIVKMPTTCFVPNCTTGKKTSKKDHDEKPMLFKAPRSMLQTWIDVLQDIKPDQTFTNGHMVCSKHFAEADIVIKGSVWSWLTVPNSFYPKPEGLCLSNYFHR